MLDSLGRNNEARDAYIEVIKRDGGHIGALGNLGTLLYNAGYRSAARLTYNEALKHHPRDLRTLINLANALLENDELALSFADPTREDGYSVRGLTIQGVRSYDSNTEQWTTPDAYKGDVDDPMSQRSYMWNNNNPVSYADPTGYSPLNLGMLAEMDGEAYADDVAADGGAVSYAPSTASDSSYVKLQAVGLEAGANAIYYSNDTKDLPADKFMQGVGEMVSSGLKWVGDPLPVTTDSSSVSAHDQYGSSLRITGNANGVDVALSHGANNNINTFISWDGTNKWVQSQVHY